MTETTWARPPVRQRAWAGLLAAAVAAGLLVLAPSVRAAPVLVKQVPDSTAGADGRVEAIVRSEGWVYIGGSFTAVSGQPRAGLARLDVTTGAVDRTWRADVVGRVATLAANGGTLYVGGEFSSVGGQARENLAAVSTATPGSVLPWNPGANRAVEALAASGTDVYVGGKFERIGGISRSKLAKLGGTSGTVDATFLPNPNQWVAALVLSGDQLYAGGFFTAIGGATQSYLGALDPATGASSSWRPSLTCPVYGLDLAADGSTVYVACGGSGGSALAFSTSANTRLWLVRTNGNLHAVARIGDAVYLGGHHTTMSGAARKKGGAVDAANGALTGWNPVFNSSFGVFTMLAVDGALWAGGDFTKVGSTRQLRVARFSPG